MLTYLLPLLASVAAVCGFHIARTVPDELAKGKPLFTALAVLCSCVLFLITPWYDALLVIGASLIGWVPGLLGGAYATAHASIIAAELGILVAFAIGVRWRAENRRPAALYLWSVAAAVLGAALLFAQTL